MVTDNLYYLYLPGGGQNTVLSYALLPPGASPPMPANVFPPGTVTLATVLTADGHGYVLWAQYGTAWVIEQARPGSSGITAAGSPKASPMALTADGMTTFWTDGNGILVEPPAEPVGEPGPLPEHHQRDRRPRRRRRPDERQALLALEGNGTPGQSVGLLGYEERCPRRVHELDPLALRAERRLDRPRVERHGRGGRLLGRVPEPRRLARWKARCNGSA